MALKREMFPDMTDEQWKELEAAVDRERTSASETARRNAKKDAETERDNAIAEAIERERAKLEADEEGKLEIRRKELNEQAERIAAERKSLAATKKLVSAGVPEDKIDSLLPLFIAVDDKTLDASLDAFIKMYQETVKTSIDAEKQTLLDNATPPNTNADAPVDALNAAAELANKGDDVGAIDLLLTNAGYTAT